MNEQTRASHDLPVDSDVTPDDRQLVAPTAEEISAQRVRPRGRARVRYLRRRVRRVLSSRGDILAAIAAGGALGSLARWGLSEALPHTATQFPWATFDANVAGCFALGVLMMFVSEVWPPSRYVRPFLGVGVLGGFTTFSTYMLDTRALLLSRHAATAGTYVLASLVAGLVALWAGLTLVRAGVAMKRRSARRRGREPRAERDEGRFSPAARGASPSGSQSNGSQTDRSQTNSTR